MADRRRRRKPVTNGDSDDSSDESVNEIINHTLSDLGSDAEGANSEYESADEEDLLPPAAQTELDEINQKLDDDEDRKNPQYIPKKGTFYEHDDRTMPPDEENNVLRSDVITENQSGGNFPGAALPVVKISSTQLLQDNDDGSPVPPGKQFKKKVWRGEDERWSHDKFEEHDQAPKAREELVSVYGYDIRSEEGAPRARRRRRYGRGPNKYTRNWEDLEAYTRPARGRGTEGVSRGGRGRGRPPHHDRRDQFPALPGQEDDNSTPTEGSEGNLSRSQVPDDSTNGKSSSSPNLSHKSGSKLQHSEPNNSLTVLHNTQTYTSQEYRRSKQEYGAGEERGARGRGRGSRGGGGGRGKADRGVGWKQSYGGGDVGSPQLYDSPRDSDDVRVSSGRGLHQQPSSPAAPQQQQGGKHTPSPRPSTGRNTATPPDLLHQEAGKHGGRNGQPHPSTPALHATHQQPSPHPLTHHQQQQQHNFSQQQQQSTHTTPSQQQLQQQQQLHLQYRQKRYSSQRPTRPSVPGSTASPLEHPVNDSGVCNPHYTPHPQHGLHYPHDSATTPPPHPLPTHGIAPSGAPSGAGVVYSGGGGGGLMYDDGGGGVTGTATPRHPHPLPPPQTAPLPPPSQFMMPHNAYVGDAYLGAGRGPVPPRLYQPGSQDTRLLPPGPVTVVGPVLAPPLPVAATVAPPPAVARATFIPADGLINPGFTGQPPPQPPPPQQYPAPPPPQYSAFQPYPPPVPAEGTQPQEIYRNGVMYYNTQSQQPQRFSVILQKRPKAAIPIVPPPDQTDSQAVLASAGGSRDDKSDCQVIGDATVTDGEYQQGLASCSGDNDTRGATVDAYNSGCVRQIGSYGDQAPLGSVLDNEDLHEEVTATVDPADHYTIQQLQLQQEELQRQQLMLQSNEDSAVQEREEDLTNVNMKTEDKEDACVVEDAEIECEELPSTVKEESPVETQPEPEVEHQESVIVGKHNESSEGKGVEDDIKFEDSVEHLDEDGHVSNGGVAEPQSEQSSTKM